MQRVAIVTGGTRGIGGAIALGLKAAGYRVASVYADNDTAAQAFHEHSGIPVFRWDVSDYAVSYTHLTLPTKRIV